VSGFGPASTGTVIGGVTGATRFPSRDHLASYNGTAPVEVPSGNRKIYRLPRRGNRRINHALHMAAVTQIRHAHSDGRAYYDRKIAEGKTHKQALRYLNGGSATPPSPASRLTPGRPQPQQRRRAQEGNRGTTLTPARPAHTPQHRLFGQATPGPATTPRPALHVDEPSPQHRLPKAHGNRLTTNTKRSRSVRQRLFGAGWW
jgi:transposase